MVLEQGRAYIDHVVRSIHLRNQGVGVSPLVAVTRHVVVTLTDLVRQTNRESDVVLHGDGEAVTRHGGLPQALEQLRSQAALVPALPDAALEVTDELDAGVVYGLTLMNGDVLGHVPGELLEDADQAVEGALGAVLGERRLGDFELAKEQEE